MHGDDETWPIERRLALHETVQLQPERDQLRLTIAAFMSGDVE